MMVYNEHRSFAYNPTCGTVGCAIGHGPYAGIIKNTNEHWEEYSHRVFGVSGLTKSWSFLFDTSYFYTDNTPEGAANRIYKFLKELEP